MFDDSNATWVHVDPATGEILGVSDRSARMYRWVFNFLHDFDLPMLLRNEPARDILISVLSIAGLVIALSGIVVSWRHLRRRYAQDAESAGKIKETITRSLKLFLFKLISDRQPGDCVFTVIRQAKSATDANVHFVLEIGTKVDP